MAGLNPLANEIFLTASKLNSPEARQAYLDGACGGDQELRQQVEALIQAHAPTGTHREGLTDTDLTGAYEPLPRATEVPAALAEQSGESIGPYKLLQKLGEGGMGAVWAAEQTEPVKRRVALKVIKAGMDSTQVLLRFEAERQALALMDHQNIAKVFDAGATPQGRPYFAMELIKGIPITKYCDQEHLSPRERLELFVPVCQALQHAHQKGIIHRDLKPSNVLVALYDSKPVPKVIDFGVAKATNQKLTERTMYTEVGQIVGTLEYMAPEQADLNNLDIDTRADIYSLGVILYELLAGSPPFTPTQLRGAAFSEMLRMIREVEPPKPSTRISSSDRLLLLAANRKLEPIRLTRMVRGDLDRIVMKALEKDRGRRYETANGLALDVNRYLAGEPVSAHPPSSAYRLKKFLKKHKGPVFAASLLALALVLGLVGTSYGLRQAIIARDGEADAKLAAEQEAERARAAEAETKARADELKLVSDFQANMLAQLDPAKAGALLKDDVISKFQAALADSKVPENERPLKVKAFRDQWAMVNATDAARELIDRTLLRPAVETIDKQFKRQPLLDARLRQVLADRYRDLGLFDAARPLQERVLAIRQSVLGAEHPDTLNSKNNLGLLLYYQGKLSESESCLRAAVAECRRALGREHPETLNAITNLGGLLVGQEKSAEAEPYLREALEGRRRVLGEEHHDTLESIANLGLALQGQGKLADAESLYREAVDKTRRVLGQEDPVTLGSINNLATVLQGQGKLSDAEPYYIEILDKARRVFGEEHPNTLVALNNLGLLLKNQNKLAQAERILRDALDKSRRVLGEEHPDTFASINNLGTLQLDEAKFGEAEQSFREAFEKRRRVLGKEHLDTLTSTVNLSSALIAQGKTAETMTLLAPCESPARTAFADANTDRLAVMLLNLGKARAALAKNPADFAPAEGNLVEAQGLFVKSTGSTPKYRRDCLQALADFYSAWDKAEPGKGHDAKAAEWKKKVEAPK
jgi:non-specific serine/threonine protein kinase/serine/threonine-protein kinase